MNLILFIHASADGHLACSLVLAIGNGASVDIGVHVCFEGPFFPFDEVQLSVLSFPFGVLFFLSCGRPLCQARGPRGLLQLFFLVWQTLHRLYLYKFYICTECSMMSSFSYRIKPYPYSILLPLSFRIRTSQVGVLLWIYFCILSLYTELCLPLSLQQCQAAFHRSFS